MEASDRVALAREVARRECAKKVVTPTGEVVNCGSRSFLTCPKCARVYRRDWQAILADGVRESKPGRCTFVLLTLTAPSFGKVHRVPKPGQAAKRCVCGRRHSESERVLRGVPVDAKAYDYAGQVRFNRDVSELWRYTQIALRRALPDRFDYAAVREWQVRGVLHFHVLLRIEHLSVSRSSLVSLLEDTCAGVVASSAVDDSVVRWGRQVDARILGIEPGQVRRAISYLGKVLGYVAKDLGAEAVSNRSPEAVAHADTLTRAARDEMECTRDCHGRDCGHRRHRSMGAGSHAVSRSKAWTVLRRKFFQEQRRAWAKAHAMSLSDEPAGLACMSMDEALAIHREAFFYGVYASGSEP